MSMSISVPDDEMPTRKGNLVYPEAPHKPLDTDVAVANEPLTHERVVAEIVEAIRGIRPAFSELDLTGETNLALDLGFDSAGRVELLLEVQRSLDVDLDVGVAVMFAEITIAEIADIVVTLEDCSTDWFT